MKVFTKSVIALLLPVLLLGAGLRSVAQTVTFSETHTGGSASTAQCAAWNTFQSQLNPGNYLKMTIKGTYDQTGLVCTDRVVVNAMATAIKNASTYISPLTNGHVWSVCNRYQGEVWIDPPASCSPSNCPSPGYILRPCIGGTHSNWGGVNTATCGAPTQVMTIIFDAGYPCTDTPKTSIKGSNISCINKKFTLVPDSFYADADYKWEYSNNGTAWSNFTGTVDPTTGGIDDIITQTKWYRLTITCIANTNLVWTTPPFKVSPAPFYYCYCDNTVSTDAGPDIGKVAIVKASNDDTVLNKGTLQTGTGKPVYNNIDAKNTYTPYHDSLAWPCLYRDTTYRFVITQIHPGSSLMPSVAQVYIDYNRDGLYNPNTELAAIKAIDGTGNNPEIAVIAKSIPSNAEIGPTGMRVVISEDTIQGGPCNTIQGYGEVEDYVVEICHRPCDGPVNAGTVVSTNVSMCKDYEYTLKNTTYEKARSAFLRSWQVSGDDKTWFNVANSQGKDTLERVFTGQPLFYRYRTICPSTNDTAYSAPLEIKLKPAYKCYCYSKAVGGLGVDTSDIGGVTLGDYSSNSGGPHLLNPDANYPRTDYTDIDPIEIYTDSSYRFTVYHTMPVVQHGDAKVTIFMDFNNNHKYDIPSERIYTGFTNIGNHTLIDNVIVPRNAIVNVPTGMRVILNNNVGPNIPSDEACGPYLSGETEDYLLIFRQKGLGINDTKTLNGFSVHPNPTSGKFYVQFNTNADVSDVVVRVTNVTGQLIQQYAYEYEGGMLYKEINMTGNASGVYFVELEAGGEKLMTKLVLQ